LSELHMNLSTQSTLQILRNADNNGNGVNFTLDVIMASITAIVSLTSVTSN
jgi:hypothetical protein